MAWYIRIDEKEDFNYLKKFIDTWAVKSKDNPSAYSEYVDMFSRLQQAFDNSTQAEEIEITKAIERPSRKSKETKTVTPLKFCSEHPTYQAKRSPRTPCDGCWQAFEKYAGKDRATKAKLKFERKVNGS